METPWEESARQTREHMAEDGGVGATAVQLEELGRSEMRGEIQKEMERDNSGHKQRMEQWEHIRRKYDQGLISIGPNQ